MTEFYHVYKPLHPKCNINTLQKLIPAVSVITCPDNLHYTLCTPCITFLMIGGPHSTKFIIIKSNSYITAAGHSSLYMYMRSDCNILQ